MNLNNLKKGDILILKKDADMLKVHGWDKTFKSVVFNNNIRFKYEGWNMISAINSEKFTEAGIAHINLHMSESSLIEFFDKENKIKLKIKDLL